VVRKFVKLFPLKRNISDILYKYAFEVYGRSVLIRDNAYPERPNNEWFDGKCANWKVVFVYIHDLYHYSIL
jgi:hypothetical protein